MDVGEPEVQIFEQPKQRGMRFRYRVEGRSAGSIPGERSSDNNRTYPSIQILNYCGKGKVRVSLVSKSEPYKPHPHDLVGKTVKTESTRPSLDLIAESSLPREQLLQTEEYDLNVVRLCIQVYLQDESGQFTRALNPIVTNPIYDNRSPNTAELRICRVNRNSGSVKGQDEIFLLCDKVQKGAFLLGGRLGGQGFVSQADVHRQVAIVFKTPAYYKLSITESVGVQMQLRRPSDQEVSEPIDFRYLPDDKDPYGYNEKKRKREDLMKLATLHSHGCELLRFDEPNSSNTIEKSTQRHVFPSTNASTTTTTTTAASGSSSSGLQPKLPITFCSSNLPPSPWPSSNIPMDSVTVNPGSVKPSLHHQQQPQRNLRQPFSRPNPNPGLPQLSMHDLKCLESGSQLNQGDSHPLYHLPHVTENRLQTQNPNVQMQWPFNHNTSQNFNGAGGGDGGGLGYNYLDQFEVMKQEPQIAIGHDTGMHSPRESSTYTTLQPPRPSSNGVDLNSQQPLKHLTNECPSAQPGTHYDTLEDWLKSCHN
ncbi:hypothetical protein WMY93_018049 [Mugilogobius chulae]|uniref:RHD domain-containing protein n=1 Tax=Mugilogobius chulae TaxID=88201 RepID=A0AAW0NHR3_9GOBI